MSSEFKVGDKVRVVERAVSGSLDVGYVGYVTEVSAMNTVRVDNVGAGWFLGGNGGSLAKVYANPPHKHAEIIKAWADGAIVERFSKMQDAWVSATTPMFNPDEQYRLAADQRTEKQRVLDDKIAAAKETLARLEDERKSL